MKILHIITQTELGGAIAVVAHLANKQSETHDVIVVGGEGDGTLWKILNPKISQEPCSTLLREISPINDIKTAIFFSRLNSKYRPDIVHLHSSKAGILGRIAFPSKKVVYTVHGFDSIRLAYRKFLPLEQAMQYLCSAIVGVSQYDERNMRADKITRNVSYVYNGIYPASEKVEIKLPDLSAYRKRILCIARLAKPKNHELFIEIARKNPDYAFLWIGNKELPENLPANCYFLGSIPNAAVYNSEVDLCLLTSNYEGLPMTILEAMSYSKPVVASAVGGISEIVRNDVNGYTLENREELFTEKIRCILEDEELYKSMSESSLQIFNEHLTGDKVVEGYNKIYQRIYNKNNRL